MIIKNRDVPIRLLANEALHRRLSKNHPKRIEIEQDSMKRRAGHRGEIAVDYFLNYLPKNHFLILQDLRLPIQNNYFQIDTLLLTPRFALIIEVKNITGTLWFDTTFKQLIRKNADKEDGFSYPITQVKRQANLLNAWFHDHKLPPIPIECLVVISHSSSIIKTENTFEKKSVQKTVVHAENCLESINRFNELHQKEYLTKSNLNKFTRLLLKHHHPQPVDILSTYQIEPTMILTGVHCPNCHFLPIQKASTKWICQHCHTVSKHAYVGTIQDYFLVLSPTITNQQCKAFLHLPSSHEAYYMLKSLNLPTEGKNKGRFYIWDRRSLLLQN
ncbi:nuclease-related domain-containing protein [Bacillus salitolerans]|uniref:Nuclease-related domain-containing protein n=1 Tax=Bacillus salitolerans TaxID=1437434 RepID=A0ABW4LWP7_9BACI